MIKVEVFSTTNSSSFNAKWIEIDSPSGLFVVGSGHINTISQLKPGGRLTYETEDNNQISLSIPGGIAIIQNNVVKLILFSSTPTK